MVKKILLFLTMLISYVAINQQVVQAKTYDYQPGQPVLIKNSGVHYTFLNYQVLENPLPEFVQQDVDEVERYVLLSFEASVAANNDSDLSVFTQDYVLKVGPNKKDATSDEIPDSLAGQHLLYSSNTVTVKRGQKKAYKVIFRIQPKNNNIKLVLNLGAGHQAIINLQKVTSKNGVLASLGG